MGRVHLLLHRASGGRALGRVAGMPVLFLTTTGRRSGKQRTTPLTYFRDGAELAVIASNGGEDRPPAWSLNLLAHPQASVELDGRAVQVHARVASDEERARLWPTITARYGGYARYEQRTARRIPVIFLTPDP
jgi:deazaflavin-dependent oxidoreductase (nitroreductase family)